MINPMTVYELAKTLDAEQLEKMTKAGIVAASVTRYVFIYEKFVRLLKEGFGTMEAYAEISQTCFTSEENVRKIIRKMQSEI